MVKDWKYHALMTLADDDVARVDVILKDGSVERFIVAKPPIA